MSNPVPSLGIFWCYQQKIIGEKVALTNCAIDSLGMMDSPLQHWHSWEKKQIYWPQFPELWGTEYQQLPRGRVVFNVRKQLFIVYADKSLLRPSLQNLITEFFAIPAESCHWRIDPHYRQFPGSI